MCAMAWDAGILDMVLVPSGLALLVAYHVHLWLRVRSHPESTVIGTNHLTRLEWVINIMTVRPPFPSLLNFVRVACRLSFETDAYFMRLLVSVCGCVRRLAATTPVGFEARRSASERSLGCGCHMAGT